MCPLIEMVVAHMLFGLTQGLTKDLPDVVAVPDRLPSGICLAILPLPVHWLFDLDPPAFPSYAKQVPDVIGLLVVDPLLRVYRLMSRPKYNSFAWRITEP